MVSFYCPYSGHQSSHEIDFHNWDSDVQNRAQIPIHIPNIMYNVQQMDVIWTGWATVLDPIRQSKEKYINHLLPENVFLVFSTTLKINLEHSGVTSKSCTEILYKI